MKEIALYTLDIAQNSITAQAKRLDITLTEEGETITLSIRDDGTGMAPELLARVSDPFTTPAPPERWGLGYPCCVWRRSRPAVPCRLKVRWGSVPPSPPFLSPRTSTAPR